MNFIRFSFLVLRNYIDMVGFRAFLLRVFGIQFLNLFVIATIFTHQNTPLHEYALFYHYFIPFLVLSSSLASWEVELTSLLGEEYLLRSSGLFSFPLISRMVITFIETLAPVLVIFLIMGLSHLPMIDFLVASVEWLTFAVLGASTGFVFGFYNEKSVNNYLNSVAWVLGFGPGPFMGLKPEAWQFIFPGAQSLAGEPGLELIKLFSIFLVAMVVFQSAKQPRALRFFAR